ncbi:MAG: T9SS type A sorting domain-containing protein [Muribaculaceae bacterium]|nr:T9SS type A sorting domain-containing protein [Muribaculaceae bacterium]
MKKYLLSILTLALSWTAASSQSIVSIPVNQNPLFEVFTNNLEMAYPDDMTDLILGADIVIKGGSGTYEYLWLDSDGNQLGTDPTLTVSGEGKYILTVSDTCDCEQTVTFNITSAAVDEVSAAGIGIFPNPTTGYVRIEGFQPFQIVAMDMSGHIAALINSEDGQSIQEADFSSLPSGIYLLTLSDGHGKKTVCRIIKK